MGMLSLLYKLRSSTALAAVPRCRPRPKLVWVAPSILDEHARAPGPAPELEPAAPFEVDGVQVVVCTTYDQAKTCILEMIADADGKPIAVDLETCPVSAERERLEALLAERKTVNAAAIAFRKTAKKAGALQAEIDAFTEEANAKLKVLGHKIDYCASAGLDPWRAEVRTLQVYGGKARAAIVDISQAGTEALGLLQGADAIFHNAPFDLAFLDRLGVSLRRVHCTQQAARLTIGANKCSLASAVKHYCKVTLGKDLQTSDWSAPVLTADQLTYAARDVIWLWRVCPPLFRELKPQAGAYRIQIAAAGPLAKMNNAGITFDLDRHVEAMQVFAEADLRAATAYQDACVGMGKPELATKIPKTAREITVFLHAILTEDELDGWRRTKKRGELSTAAAALRQASHYPPLEPLIELSKLASLRASFGESLRFRQSPGASIRTISSAAPLRVDRRQQGLIFKARRATLGSACCSAPPTARSFMPPTSAPWS
jgi:hypothetical protein